MQPRCLSHSWHCSTAHSIPLQTVDYLYSQLPRCTVTTVPGALSHLLAVGWAGKAGNEVLNQHLMQRPGIGAAGTGLEPTECGRTGQCLIAPDGRLHQQVRAQRVVIVQVFVAAAQAIQALGDEIAQAVANPTPGTPIGQGLDIGSDYIHGYVSFS